MDFISSYLQELKFILDKIDLYKIELMLHELIRLKSNGGRLFILGIGGSSANASHAVNDFRKLVGIEAYAPTDNIAEVTARTNDEGFETIFERYLFTSKLTSTDCILILSVGGGDTEKNVSRNICLAIEFAQMRRAKVLGIVGRVHGCTAKQADICLVIPEVNALQITPYSEVFQSVIWHLLVSHPKLAENKTKW